MNMEKEFERVAKRVSFVTIIGNVALSVLKLIAGIWAHSSAMISDAIHSASDVFSTIIVIIGIKLAAKEPDKEHPYGHERMECVAAIILSMILFITGLGIGMEALETILDGNYDSIQVPGMLALVAAIVSIVSKEAMYWYTRYHAKRIDSGALMADAWHHRSDALSSIGSFIGILGARMGYPILDPVASIIICLMILHASYEVFSDAVHKMVDHSCDEETTQELCDLIHRVPGVEHVDSITTRIFGNRIYVDVEISVDDMLPLIEAHHIAETTHAAIEANFPLVKHCMVHVNPLSESDHASTIELPDELKPYK